MDPEPILNLPRKSLYPIQNDEIWSLYKRAQTYHWTIEEIDLSNDENHYKKLSEIEKYHFTPVWAIFALTYSIID